MLDALQPWLLELLPSEAALRGYLVSGGLILAPLAALALTLWYLIGARLLTLHAGSVVRRAHAHARQELARAETDPDGALRLVFYEHSADLGRYRRGIRAITAVAPLLGLLGTVSGMIETFDAMTGMTLFAASGGIAGGVSEALVTTQMGLFVAIPGLLVGRLLDRREERLRQDLEGLRRRLRAAQRALVAGAS
jgi:biopolymer transport protein ExbB